MTLPLSQVCYMKTKIECKFLALRQNALRIIDYSTLLFANLARGRQLSNAVAAAQKSKKSCFAEGANDQMRLGERLFYITESTRLTLAAPSAWRP